MPRFLDWFSVVLFDLHGTLMFGSDRFGPDQEYYDTYRALGGRRLNREAVTTAVTSCLEGLLQDYDNADKWEDFPTVAEAFRCYAGSAEQDLELLEQVFAEHERGRLPPAHADFLRRLAATHQLGVVSNICARPASWIAAFDAAGVRQVFSTMVFSSEGRSIKPSPAPFRRALARFPSDSRVLFVGDSLERDIRPARALGMSTAWVAPHGASDPAADVTVPSVLSLETMVR